MFCGVFDIGVGTSVYFFLVVHVALISGYHTMIAETSVYGGMMHLHGTHMRSTKISVKMYFDMMARLKKDGKISEVEAMAWAFLLTMTFISVGGLEYVRRMCGNARNQ